MGRTPGTVSREITYNALPSQKQFHECSTRFKGFSGPIGSGKSMALCQEAIRLSYINPGRMGLLAAPTYPMLRDATQATLFDILNSNRIPYEHNKAENTLTMLDTRSRIVFRPADEFERLRGTNLAWFGLDELTYTQEEAWLRLQGRLRDPKATQLCGFAVWTPKGYDWVYRMFVSHPTEDFRVIMARPRENVHLLSRTKDFYDLLEKSYDETFFRQEVLGEYLSHSGGKVYGSFNRKEHLSTLNVSASLPLLWSLDFNVDPMCSVIAQKHRDAVFVLDEIFLRHGTTVGACEEFLRRYPSHTETIEVFGDASGNSRQTTGASDYDMIREHFQAHARIALNFHVPTANPPVRDRINVTNRQLRAASGDIGMLIDPKCKELIEDLEQVSYKGESWEIDKERDRMRTHLSDALGYLLCAEYRPESRYGEQGNRIV